MAHLVFDVVVEVADGGHAGTLVDGLLDFRRHRHVFQNEAGDLDAVLAGHRRVDDRQQRFAQFRITRGHIQRRHAGLGQRFGEHADDARTHGVGELIQTEILVGASDFLEELRRINNAEIVGAERTQAHHAEIGVAHHHRVGCAPLVAGEQARVEVIDVALERRFEAVLPAQDGRQHRDVLGAEAVLAGAEQIGVLAGGHELHHLRFTHDQLRAVLDLAVVVRPAVGQRVTRVIGPFDDLDQFLLDEAQNAHGGSPEDRAPILRPVAANRRDDTTHTGSGARCGECRGCRSAPCGYSHCFSPPCSGLPWPLVVRGC
ncbi:hypothetical protein D3C81_827130 [compost metagenome]